jgi:hypothetical protein
LRGHTPDTVQETRAPGTPGCREVGTLASLCYFLVVLISYKEEFIILGRDIKRFSYKMLISLLARLIKARVYSIKSHHVYLLLSLLQFP